MTNKTKRTLVTSFGVLLFATLLLAHAYTNDKFPDYTEHDAQAVNEGIDVGVFPHWGYADEQLGKESRFTDNWCGIACGTYTDDMIEMPRGDYMLRIINTEGLTLIYANADDGRYILQDTIFLDSIGSWIYKHNE